jgi:hypothetical protein
VSSPYWFGSSPYALRLFRGRAGAGVVWGLPSAVDRDAFEHPTTANVERLVRRNVRRVLEVLRGWETN